MSRRTLSKKENSAFNGIWAKHARKFGKKTGAKNKRKAYKHQLKKELDTGN